MPDSPRHETLSEESRAWTSTRWFGLVAGPLLALALYHLLPVHYVDSKSGALVPLASSARATLAVMAWMGVWWLTEALDIAVTALLPIVVFPLAGIASIGGATAPYANAVIFLFLGGFVLALSMQRWGLDRRIALVTLRFVGTRPSQMIGGFMLATAALSAFVSNTATTALMLPIGLSVIALADRAGGGGAESRERRNFPVALMLAIAFASSIGGMATIIGTPPNLFLVGFLHDTQKIDVSFVGWLRVGLPLVAVLLPLAWLILTRWVYPVEREPIPGVQASIREALAELGGMGRGERSTLWVFVLTALAWIFRPLVVKWSVLGAHPLAQLSDTGVAMIAALALFLIPVDAGKRVFVMDWKSAEKLPWGVLILFGGGLSLASAVEHNQVAEFLGSQARAFASWPALLIVVLVTAATALLTELTSNTATAATLVPILAALAPGLGIPVLHLVIPATLAASCAFMLPVATPPNAIVFASGRVTIRQMLLAGVWLDLLAVLPVTALAYLGPAIGR